MAVWELGLFRRKTIGKRWADRVNDYLDRSRKVWDFQGWSQIMNCLFCWEDMAPKNANGIVTGL